MYEGRVPPGYGPESELDPDGPDPVWLQLSAILIARIERGEYVPHRPIPSITQLVQEFGLARGTVRKSTTWLAEQGIVRVVNGKGVFVLPRD
ncbi:winged helix-turn-helix transcriptional regulator [Spiractinospora alimapuensis]|uniref:GntR family transcriptional regulator n=1 Tax=Spiractinospora alimapuensis TaxID=2820884 RepID=UPI001F36D1A5|nr:winged helix-turn-helix domain-containing protein [Spiractinospora alimapuensis]QVQ53781.1 winged helix-turn-helix transcriptional regulator [Spiractinospora alimapuensis]